MNTQGAVLTSIGNSKNKTGTDKITANSRSSSGIGQMLFERCSSCCCYCVKSEFFCPRWLNEKLFASNNRRTKDVACDSWAEGCCDWFLRVPGALVLSRDERTYKNKLDTKKGSRTTEEFIEITIILTSVWYKLVQIANLSFRLSVATRCVVEGIPEKNLKNIAKKRSLTYVIRIAHRKPLLIFFIKVWSRWQTLYKHTNL